MARACQRLLISLVLLCSAAGAFAQVGAWVFRRHMLDSRLNFGAATGPDGRIYVFGGKNTTVISASEAYDPSTDTWSPIAPLPTTDESGLAVTGPDGRIYIFYYLNAAYVYDTTTDTYAPITKPPFSASAAGLGSDGKIYAVGLNGNSGVTMRYDTLTDTWSSVFVSTPYFGGSACGVAGPDGRLYVFGGADSNQNFQKIARVYDPHADVWLTLPDMIEPHDGGSAMVGGDGRIYVVSGFNGTTAAGSEAFDPTDNSWSTVPSPTLSRFRAASATSHDGQIFVIGTGDTVESYRPATLRLTAPALLAATEGTAMSAQVATIIDSASGHTVDDFSATVDWADGSTTPASIVADSTPGRFKVMASHTYKSYGLYAASVSVADADSEGATASTQIKIDDASLTGAGASINAFANVSFTGKVATFKDANASSNASDFTATIHWGDGLTSQGTVSVNGDGYDVSGTHTYALAGSFSTSVDVSDAGGSSTHPIGNALVSVALPSVIAAAINPVEGSSFSGAVATFTDADITVTAASFTATVDWGDGSVTPASVSGGAGSFSVNASHTYKEEGSYVTKVTVKQGTLSTTIAMGAASVADAPLVATGVNYIAKNKNFTGVVATFVDGSPSAVAGEFTATILWGDGAKTQGTVAAASGKFTVSGSHLFSKKIVNQVQVFIKDSGGSTATANSAIDTRTAK